MLGPKTASHLWHWLVLASPSLPGPSEGQKPFLCQRIHVPGRKLGSCQCGTSSPSMSDLPPLGVGTLAQGDRYAPLHLLSALGCHRRRWWQRTDHATPCPQGVEMNWVLRTAQMASDRTDTIPVLDQGKNLSSGCTGNCQYLLLKSRVENILDRASWSWTSSGNGVMDIHPLLSACWVIYTHS